jgi:hypothetical protein
MLLKKTHSEHISEILELLDSFVRLEDELLAVEMALKDWPSAELLALLARITHALNGSATERHWRVATPSQGRISLRRSHQAPGGHLGSRYLLGRI